MIEVFPVTLPRLSGKQSRRVYVYVPDALAADPDARYPVLYMFDGHNVFFDQDATYGKSWGMKEYMDQTQTPLIIVAVECNHAPNNARLSEYSPFTFQEENLGRIRGRGKWTMEWLVQETQAHDRRPVSHPAAAGSYLYCRQLHGWVDEPVCPGSL